MQIQSIYHEKTIHEQLTEIYDLWYCAVALLKALTTYNIHNATKMYKNYAYAILHHLRSNALIIN